MSTLTVSLPDDVTGWIEGQIGEGGYASAGEYVKDGKLTQAGIDELKHRMPHADFKDLRAGSDLEEMSRLFTVDAVVNYVQRKLEG